MKSKIITAVLVVSTIVGTSTSAFYIGSSKAVINTIERNVYVVPENYVNMHNVINYETTDDGIMLHFNDETSYYLESKE